MEEKLIHLVTLVLFDREQDILGIYLMEFAIEDVFLQMQWYPQRQPKIHSSRKWVFEYISAAQYRGFTTHKDSGYVLTFLAGYASCCVVKIYVKMQSFSMYHYL